MASGADEPITSREGLYVTGAVDASDFSPYVEFNWSVSSGSMSPEEARRIGTIFLEAAMEAEQESSMCRGLEAAGYSKVDAARVLQAIRDHRA